MRDERTKIVVAALTFVVLIFLVSSCVGQERTTPGDTTTSQAQIPAASSAAGIKFDARLVKAAAGTSDLELTITTLRRQLEPCAEDHDCPDELAFLVRSSALVDYRLSALADADELVAENEVDAISSVVQVLTFENIEPGDHCIAVFSQILQVEDGTVVGREGMIGVSEQMTLSSDDSQPTPGVNYCSTSELMTAEGTFVALDKGGCGGLPNGITSDPNGSKLPDEELMVVAPTCPQDLVTVIFRDGEIMPEATRLLAGQDRAGFLAYVMPRPEGRWRVATLPVERYRVTVPDESPYWDVVFSPPREF